MNRLLAADLNIHLSVGFSERRGEQIFNTVVVYIKQNQALVIKPNGKIIARDQGSGDELVYARITLDKNVGTGDILERRPPEFYRELIELRK